VPKATAEQSDHVVQPDVMAPRAQPVQLVHSDVQENLASLELLVWMDRMATPEKMELEACKERWDLKEPRVPEVLPDVLVCLDSPERKEQLDRREIPDKLASLERREKLDLPDNKDYQVQLDHLDRTDEMVHKEKMANQEHKATVV